jgi:hypothetical protein
MFLIKPARGQLPFRQQHCFRQKKRHSVDGRAAKNSLLLVTTNLRGSRRSATAYLWRVDDYQEDKDEDEDAEADAVAVLPVSRT